MFSSRKIAAEEVPVPFKVTVPGFDDEEVPICTLPVNTLLELSSVTVAPERIFV